jgi:hypothetical protein
LRRLLLWTVVCGVSAAPSFLFAREGFDDRAMAVGVGLFILAYTVVTSTRAFERFHDLPFVRRTLYIGYGTRLAASIFFPVGMTADVFPGMISVGLVDNWTGYDPESFTGTFLITLVQGTLLNVILTAFMAVIYTFQRLFMKPPPPRPPRTRGFEVLPPASPNAQGPMTNQ